MSYLLVKLKYKDGKWQEATQEFSTLRQAQEVGKYCIRKGWIQDYEIYHS